MQILNSILTYNFRNEACLLLLFYNILNYNSILYKHDRQGSEIRLTAHKQTVCARAFHSSTHIDASERFFHIDIHIPSARNVEADLTETIIDIYRCTLALNDRIVEVYAGWSETVIHAYRAQIVGIDILDRLAECVVKIEIFAVALLTVGTCHIAIHMTFSPCAMLFRLKDHGKADAAEKRGAKYRPRRECGNPEWFCINNAEKGDREQNFPEVQMTETFNKEPCQKHSENNTEHTDRR